MGIINALVDIAHQFLPAMHYLLNPMFCCDSGGIEGIPFSPTAHATLLDTFPEVIRISWLLPSASNEKGTPRETAHQTGCCLERGSEPSPGKSRRSTMGHVGGGGVGRGTHNSTSLSSGGDDAQNPWLTLSLTTLWLLGWMACLEWDHLCAYGGFATLQLCDHRQSPQPL